MRILRSVAIAGAALAAFGVLRILFNVCGLSLFGPTFIGRINPEISLAALMAFLLAGPFAAVVSKFAGEWLGSGQAEKAYVLVKWTGSLTLVTAIIVMLIVTAWGNYSARSFSVAAYFAALVAYIWIKAVLFAFRMSSLYAILEGVGILAFVVVFIASVVTRIPLVALWALTSHLGCVGLGGLLPIYRHIRRTRPWKSVYLPRMSRLIKYLVASYGLSLSGLAAYHAVIVLAGSRMARVSDIAYLSTLFSSLAPLNLVAAAAGTVLLPELAFSFGAGDGARLRRIVCRGSIGLAAIFGVVGAVVVFGAPMILPALGIPATREWYGVWGVTVVAVCVSNTSSIAGHYLNATDFIRVHALLSLVAAVSAVAFGWYAMGKWGPWGAAFTRFVAVVPLAVARTVVAFHSILSNQNIYE